MLTLALLLPLPPMQVFDSMNQALRISCLRGLPVRVVRSWKEKRGTYAPPEPQVGGAGLGLPVAASITASNTASLAAFVAA